MAPSAGESSDTILTDKSELLVDDATDRDTYTISVTTKLTGITGVKLDAQTHQSMPGMGTRRGDAERPHFILNKFDVTDARAGGTP